MDTSLDLVDHFKLEAEQLPEYTQHTHYKSDRSHGLRRLKIVKRWRKKHDIGEGAFGIVWLEVEEDGSERAVKAISRRLCSYSKIDYKKELAAMAILSKYEELFVAFHGWFEGPEHIFVAMEYFKHGDLQRHMDTKMPEIQVKIVIIQVLEGLKTMHQLGFTHRDLKPQNIFVVDTDPIFWVKIGDFGITKRILNEQTFLRTEIGTLDYLAPEVLGYVEEETSRYTNAVDLWSLGCICHRLLTMESPFPKTIALTRYCLGMTELPIEALHKSTVTEEAITLVKDLMNAQPSERIDAEAALHSLWLKDVESLDSTFTVQSESRLPANPDDGLAVHDAELPQDSKLPETSIETRKKRREPLNIETPSTTRNGQSSPSTVLLKPVLEHQILNTESKQQKVLGSDSMPMNNSIPISPSALGENDLDASSLKSFLDTSFNLKNYNLGEDDPDASSLKGFLDAGFDLEYYNLREDSLKSFLDAGFDLKNYNLGFQGYAVKAFVWAARQSTPDCLYLLLRKPHMIDVIESLYWAVREDVLIAVQAIIEATQIDINRQTHNGLTPLHLACMHGHEEIARYLLENGALVNACGTSGMTPLHFASLADCEASGPITVLLEEYGALEGHIPVASVPAISELMMSGSEGDLGRNPPELRTREGLTFKPIMTLQELPAEVLSRGEYLQARFRMAGHYPDVLALADRAFRWAAKENSEDLMVYVLEYGAPVDVSTLLRYSTTVNGNPQAIALLKVKRATTNPLHSFTNPLHTACFYGQLSAIVALLDGVRPIKKVLRSKDLRGRTALHIAVGGRGEEEDGERQELVNMLLNLGADPTERDMNGLTPVLLAKAWRCDEMITTLNAAIKRKLESPPTPEDAFFEVETMETPADTTQSSSRDDGVSNLICEVSSGDETGRGLAYKAEKVEEPWWRSAREELLARMQATARS